MTLFNLLLMGLKKITKNNKGQAMVEYGLIIALVAIIVIAVLVFLGPAIADIFQQIIDQLGE